MLRRTALGLIALAPAAAWGQALPHPQDGVPIACFYHAAIPTLSDGQEGFVQCGSNGAVNVNVVSGGTGGSGTSNTVAPTNAGTSATTANPVQGVTGGVPVATIPQQGGAAVSGTNPLSTSQVVGGTVNVIGVGTGSNATLAANTSTTIVPTASGVRYRATVYNTSTSGTLWIRSDGQAAVVGKGIPIQPNAAYEWDFPLTGAAPAPAIIGIMSAAGTVSGEYVQ